MELGYITHEKIRRNRILFKLFCIPGYMLYMVVCAYIINGARGFWQGFLHIFSILSVLNIIDRFVVDELWVGHTKMWEIPDTEDLKPYINRHDKCMKWRNDADFSHSCRYNDHFYKIRGAKDESIFVR